MLTFSNVSNIIISLLLFQEKLLIQMYHRQQNKCYPSGVYLSISKLHLILTVANLLAYNNISQICYTGQIYLQSAI